MDELLSEKEQLEEIRKWWSDNGAFVVAGLALGIGALAGWNYWKNHQRTQAEQGSAIYSQLLDAVNTRSGDAATTLGDQLQSDFAGTPYLAQGALALAKLHIEQGDAEAAEKQLRAALSSSKDEQLSHVVRLRLARVLLERENYAEALTLLNTASAGKFAARYHEVRGDAYVAQGSVEQARNEYDLALQSLAEGLGDPRVLQMKRDDLAALQEATPATAAENGS